MAAGSKIRVRMYRVGFGDCFLVTIPDGETQKHILIDCGVHAQSEFKGIAAAVQAIKTETQGELAVVVATHAHADHISGFGTEADAFRQFTVGEVWMPWLEDLSNPAAKKLHAKTAALAGLLHAHLNVAGAEADPLITGIALNALGANGRSPVGNNAKALALLRGGFGDKKRTKYLKAGRVLQNAGGIKGLTVRVLAPSDDPTFLSRMNPPEAQLYGLDKNGDPTLDTLVPFAERWTGKTGALDPVYEKFLHEQVATPMRALALSVDNYLNNTSLCLLLQYKGRTLLFPGDAQWGNWQSWQGEWEAILNDIDFYKVGHHGSHNATPHEALRKMTGRSVAAMASTDTVTAFNRGKFPVPYSKLVSAVKKQVGDRYAQSDQIAEAAAPFELDPGGGWVDYLV